MFLYFGHGGAEAYTHQKSLSRLASCSVALLFGCSSGHLSTEGNLDLEGTSLNYLQAGSLSVLGNLWDITDKDIDRFTVCLFDEWGLESESQESLSLPAAVSKSRSICTLKYLNGAAVVVYGLPVYIG